MSTIRTCNQLIKEFPFVRLKQTNTKLPIILSSDDKRDIYNISSPFFYRGKQIILGRAEPRESEDSDTVFLVNQNGFWKLDLRCAPLKHLQDPFYCTIHETLIIGGVEVQWSPDEKRVITYHTVFYRETAPYMFERFAEGPKDMKDIRLLELPGNNILVATRPQGIDGSRGRIGFKIIDSLDKLNCKSILSAKILDDQFIKEEWGGVNGLYLLGDGKIGVLSHIARFDETKTPHYYSTCFILDARDFNNLKYTPMRIIATRSNFEDGPFKRKELQDVVFSGGIVRPGNGTAKLYCGVGDSEAHCISILDPFSYRQ